jgi:predicted O-methyltransferase YrrM
VKAGLRTARAPIQSLALKRYEQLGLPPRLYPAFAYLLTGTTQARERAVAARVEGLRAQLAQRGSMTIADYAGKLEVPGVEHHTFQQIAERVSVTRHFGIFLYLCAEGFEAKRILELGACAGISGCYLASASSCVEFVTLELSPALADIARQNLGAVSQNATVINATFDKGLNAVIGPEAALFDLVWIDGHHEKDATLRYFERLRTHVPPGGLILFDDIHWTPEMREAWDIIRAWPGFSATVNANRMGLGVLKQAESPAPPQNWSLKRRLGITTFERE